MCTRITSYNVCYTKLLRCARVPMRSFRAKMKLFLFAAVILLTLAAPAGAQTAAGKLTGGIVYSLPDWFKPSFLDLREDVEEARKANRHVMLFLHLDECPYRNNFV